MGQDVVVGDEDLEEEEEEEDESVAGGNRPAEIVKRALEVGELEEDETVERCFTDTREAGDLAHGVHGVVVVRLTLGEEDIKGLLELPSSWQDLLLLDVNAQALGVIAVVDSRSVLAWPNADALPHTLLVAPLFEFVGCASEEWNEHGPIQCVPPPLSVKYHPDCSTPYVYATAAEVFAMGYGAPTPFFCDMPLPSNELLPDAPVENVDGFAHAGYFIQRHSFNAVIGEAI